MNVAWSIRGDDLARELRGFAVAYPADCFFPVTDEELKQHGGVVTRASAAMGRHFAPLFIAAANEIERLGREISEASPVPDGWKLVPILSTAEMHQAAADSIHRGETGPLMVWSAMVAASPEAPK